jgi:hypothetical protein
VKKNVKARWRNWSAQTKTLIIKNGLTREKL